MHRKVPVKEVQNIESGKEELVHTCRSLCSPVASSSQWVEFRQWYGNCDSPDPEFNTCVASGMVWESEVAVTVGIVGVVVGIALLFMSTSLYKKKASEKTRARSMTKHLVKQFLAKYFLSDSRHVLSSEKITKASSCSEARRDGGEKERGRAKGCPPLKQDVQTPIQKGARARLAINLSARGTQSCTKRCGCNLQVQICIYMRVQCTICAISKLGELPKTPN
jgi:hypothetical protein